MSRRHRHRRHFGFWFGPPRPLFFAPAPVAPHELHSFLHDIFDDVREVVDDVVGSFRSGPWEDRDWPGTRRESWRDISRSAPRDGSCDAWRDDDWPPASV